MTRPEILDGKTIKTVIGCGNLYMTANILDGKLFELFINGSKSGGCHANQQSIGRLATLCFKHDIPIDEIIDQLSLIKCPACTRAKAKLSQDDIRTFPTSCGDAVAKFLARVKDEISK